ncbi:hypothetical protein MMJ09_23185, partial [Bacillus vallismortis]|nr:hypothetical protein [Bacillus vallismortis]
HQDATDIGWAYTQVSRMYSQDSLLDGYTLYYDVPEYQYKNHLLRLQKVVLLYHLRPLSSQGSSS